ncbi:MAG: AI-2E family transporter [Candidatus Kapabacteria bacterium]|nr:AI-2E family transporter [Candidatus Kapabacteria bacterium]
MSIVVSICLLAVFMLYTNLLQTSIGPLLIFSIVMYLLSPLRGESAFVKRLLLLSSIIFVIWLLLDLGILLMPFILSFGIAYLLDPLITNVVKRKLPRTIASLAVVLSLLSVIVLVSIFIFPNVFDQLNDVIKKVSSLVSTSTQYMESQQFYLWLEQFGISPDHARELVQRDIVPRLETVSQYILTAIMTVLTSLTSVVAQAVNAILIPVLTFYFVNDMPTLKKMIRSLLEKKNQKVLNDLIRINTIIRAYIGGQIISATFVGVSSTILFLIFGIPYPFVLGVLCGLLNPIPYAGTLASMLIAFVTILLVDINGAFSLMLISLAIILGMHFIATYFIDPKITGGKVGVHPVMLILSLFVFGHFFGFLGLVVAVPVTAVLMMYFNDWKMSRFAENTVELQTNNTQPPVTD